MKRVKLIGPGLKLKNSWYWIGEKVDISDAEYEKNKEHLELLEDIYEETVPQATTPTNPDESESENNNPDENEDLHDGSNEDNGEDEELEILRSKAKELGIANAGRMKKETLVEKIAEKEQNA